MRVTNLMPDTQYGIQQSEQSLSTALQQLTTGKRVNQISDDPTAYANNVRSLAQSCKRRQLYQQCHHCPLTDFTNG